VNQSGRREWTDQQTELWAGTGANEKMTEEQWTHCARKSTGEALADRIQPGPRRMAEAAKIKASSGFHEEVSRQDGNEKSELGSDLKTRQNKKW
jgi:hypothetical protein